jgi:hypothetical protein
MNKIIIELSSEEFKIITETLKLQANWCLDKNMQWEILKIIDKLEAAK